MHSRMFHEVLRGHSPAFFSPSDAMRRLLNRHLSLQASLQGGHFYLQSPCLHTYEMSALHYNENADLHEYP